MAETVVNAGDQIRMKVTEKRVLAFDWDSALNAGVTIVTSTWRIVALEKNGSTELTKDNESILTGSRKTQLRVLGDTATASDSYEVFDKIVTNETPAQEKEQSFTVLL